MRWTSITPNSTVNQIRKKVGKDARQRKRESSRRRVRLEKLARWVSGQDVKVFFQPRGAKCQKAPSGSNRDMDVFVPTDEHDQPVTDLDPAVWDFVFQKAELVHELGHVLYTDFGAMEDYLDRIDGMYQQTLFRNLFNIVEDGAIERQLASSFNVGNDLEIKNRNLLMSGEPGTETQGGQQLNFTEAIELVLMDWGKWDSGRAAKLLDPAKDGYRFDSPENRERTIEVLPILRDMVRDVVSEPNGEKRVGVAYDYYLELLPHVEDAGEMMSDPLGGDLANLFPDDANVYVVRPSDDPPEDADKLELDEDDVVIFLGGDGLAGDDDDDEMEAQVMRYGQQVNADDEKDDGADDAEAWVKASQKAGYSMRIPTDSDSFEPATWQKAMDYGKRFKRDFQQALQAQRESAIQRNQRAGRPDVQALWQLGYGESRVFENERRPEEKHYSVVLLLDRSSSMSTAMMREGEAVTAGMAWALEEVGANVAVVSFESEIFLEKPFGVSTESRKEHLCNGRTNGRTYAGAGLALAKARLGQMDGESLAMFITDGEPSDKDTYTTELQSMTFPAAGVYYNESYAPDTDDVRGYFHRITSCDMGDLERSVSTLIKRMVV